MRHAENGLSALQLSEILELAVHLPLAMINKSLFLYVTTYRIESMHTEHAEHNLTYAAYVTLCSTQTIFL